MTDVSNSVSISSLVQSGGLVTHFQPIVSVRRKAVIGVESLVRGIDPDCGQLIPPKQLFDAAHAQGMLHAFDRAARNQSLRLFAGRGFQRQMLLFLNVDIDALSTDRRAEELIDLAGALQIPASSIVLEMVESQFDAVERLDRLVTRLREHGMLIAVDDVGSGHSNLERIALIRPDILKIDRSLCSRLGSDHCCDEVFSSLVGLGRRIGSLVVAEGIETSKQAVVALERGADLLQGFLIHRPESGSELDTDAALQAVNTITGHFRDHMVNTINHNKIERRMHAILLDSMLSELGVVDVTAFSSVIGRTIRSYPDIECAYVMDHRGTQVTDTIFNAHELPPTSLMFRPAEKGCDHSLKTYYHALLDNDSSRYVTEPYVSLASGHLCRTLSATFRDASNERMYVLCIDVKST
jgi:EAL domain-containing protein (putative c-di-GMP-specific phosphodiesterase class I)